jgi:carbon storage regulator CsrA
MQITATRVGETLIIGGVAIKILAVGKRRARLGIEAPKQVLIMRGELIDDGATRQSQEPREPRGQTGRNKGSAGAATKAPEQDSLPQDV